MLETPRVTPRRFFCSLASEVTKGGLHARIGRGGSPNLQRYRAKTAILSRISSAEESLETAPHTSRDNQLRREGDVIDGDFSNGSIHGPLGTRPALEQNRGAGIDGGGHASRKVLDACTTFYDVDDLVNAIMPDESAAAAAPLMNIRAAILRFENRTPRRFGHSLPHPVAVDGGGMQGPISVGENNFRFQTRPFISALGRSQQLGPRAPPGCKTQVANQHRPIEKGFPAFVCALAHVCASIFVRCAGPLPAAGDGGRQQTIRGALPRPT